MATAFQAFAACACAAGLAAAAGTSQQTLSLDVLVQDSVGAPPDTLVEAQQIAARVFGAMQVNIVWFDTRSAKRRQELLGDAAAHRGFLTSLYVVRLVGVGGRKPPAASVGSLGFAVQGTRIATILYGRVEQRALDGGATIALVLGHVVAHELGHLLLRRRGHSAAGVMRATLDIPLAQQGRLLFTNDESREIRSSITRDRERK